MDYVTVGIFACFGFEFSSLIFVVAFNDFAIVFDRKGVVAFHSSILLENTELKMIIYHSNICKKVFSLSLVDLPMVLGA